MAGVTAVLGCVLALGSAQAAALQTTLLASDGTSSDRLGDSVAIDGDTIVAGAPFANVGAREFQGAAYVFVRTGGTWAQVAKLTASDGAAGDRFGASVAIDGETIVVGAQYDDVGGSVDQGALYVFARSGDTWGQVAKLTSADGAPGDWLGAAVAIEGDTIVAGAPQDDGAFANQGSAYAFARSSGMWAQAARLTATDGLPNDLLGTSVAIDGDTIVAGAPFDDVGSNVQQGSAYTFVRSGSEWAQAARLTASDGTADDRLGFSVAVDGDTIVAGAPADGAFRGAAYTFARTGGNRTQTARLTASDGAAQDSFGDSVAVDGGTIVAGAPCDSVPYSCQGAAYTFARTGGDRTETAKLVAADARASDQLGQSVAVGAAIVAGAPGDTVGAVTAQGSARAFAVNAAPVAADDAYAVDEDTTLSVAAPGVLGNDVDVDGDVLAADLVAPPSHGVLSLNPDGSFSYTPGANFNGADSFTYRTTDGTDESAAATVSIGVGPVDDTPVAAADGPYLGVVGQAVTLDGSASDDVEGAPLTYRWDFGDGSTLVTTSPTPAHTYAAGGVYAITLVVSDGTLDSLPATTSATIGNPIGSGRDDVDAFLSYASPSARTVYLPAGTASVDVTIVYGSSIAPATFSAELEGSPFAGFTAAPASSETRAIPLAPGRNVLVLSVEGTLADGRRATDRDRLTFVVR